MVIRKPTQDIYTRVTNQLIGYLEKGVVPWQKPWTAAGIPKNLISGRQYNGINVFLLNCLGYEQNYFLTYNQVRELGGSIKKEEKAQPVVFWKMREVEEKETGQAANNKTEKRKKQIPVLRYYNVFNIDQCEGLPPSIIPPKIVREHKPIEECEVILRNMPDCPEIRHKEHRACYYPLRDFINMPKPESFRSAEDYYSVLFHELVHSTGHRNRLCRQGIVEARGPRSQNYAIEELTAEMGASYLRSFTGLPPRQLENSAAYIQGWLKVLKGDKRFVVHAAGQAQKAVGYVLGEKEVLKSLENTQNRLLKSRQRAKGMGVRGRGELGVHRVTILKVAT